jgi:hypothetical protein
MDLDKHLSRPRGMDHIIDKFCKEPRYVLGDRRDRVRKKEEQTLKPGL